MKDIRTEIRWALLFSLISMAWMFMEVSVLFWHDRFIAGQFANHFLALIVIFASVYYLAIKEKKKHSFKGKMTWKQAFISGAILSVFIALLSPLVEYFNYHYLSPHYFENMIAYQTQKESMPMSLESAESFFNMKSFIFQTIGTDLSFGLITAVIVAQIMKTKENKK